MPLRVRIAGLLIAAGSFGAVAADQPDTIKAVAPGGPGVLTKCRSWLVTTSCRTYRHISLPSRIAVGDTITISFGSHLKEFGFYVARIDLKGQHCAIFSKAEADRHRMDKINIAPCYRSDGGANGAPPRPSDISSARSTSTSAALMVEPSAEVFG